MNETQPSGATQHYYVAVGYPDAKLETLFELLRALQARAPAGIVICCNSRDTLDSICSTATGFSDYRTLAMHSDLSEQQMDTIAQHFKTIKSRSLKDERTAATVSREEDDDPPPLDTSSTAAVSEPMTLLITTDPPLKALCKDLLPLSPLLVINYEIPHKKETYHRRMTTVLGSRGSKSAGRRRITVNFVEAGKLEELHHYEACAEKKCLEMPVRAIDILPPSDPDDRYYY